MLYVAIPTLPEIWALHADRADAYVSIYLLTTPQTQHVAAPFTSLRSKSAALMIHGAPLQS